MTLQIKKLDYSLKPWRLVKENDMEFTVPVIFDHPDLGKTVIPERIAGNSKQECLDMVLNVFEQLVSENDHLKCQTNKG